MEKKTVMATDSILETTRTPFDTTGTNWTMRKFSHPERTIRIATSFSGISAPDMALKRLGLKTKIVFASDIGERYLTYNFKRIREFALELDKEYREKFASALYEGNRANIESLNRKYRKSGKREIPFTKKLVYDSLFKDGSTIKGNNYELVKECLDIILENKGIQERSEIERYITELYDEKGPNLIKDAFFANYEIREEDWHTDIRFMDATPYKGQVDLYVGGSPCVSYSRSGKRLTLEDTRGQLFYDFAVRIKECEPKVFIFENVADMMRANDKGEKSGLEAALEVFDSLGYKLYWNVLDARNYGVPQHRERVWVIGIREDLKSGNLLFPNSIPLNLCMYDFLDRNLPPVSGKVGGIYERELTGSEYLRLMGFRDFKVPESIRNLGESGMKDALRFMAGNSMVVECLMALYLQMDITKYGDEKSADMTLKPSLYDYSEIELEELMRRIQSLKMGEKNSGYVDFSYLNKGFFKKGPEDIIKVGAQKAPKAGYGDSQWDRVFSVRGLAPTETKAGHIYIVVSKECEHVESTRPKCIVPEKRIPNPLW